MSADCAPMCTSSSTTVHRLGLHHSEHFEHSVRQKPLKREGRRGLSKFYSTKSQSFSSLELALTTQFGESALGLAKRPSSQDLVHAVQHALSTAGANLDAGDLCLLRHRNSSAMDSHSCMLQHSHSLTTGGSCLREASSLSSGGGAYGQGFSGGQGYCGSDSCGQGYGDSVATSAACCPSPRDQGSMPNCDLCLPSWLHRSTEELCAALHSASLARDGQGSSSTGGSGSAAQAAHQRLMASSFASSGSASGPGGAWGGSGHFMRHLDADAAGTQHLLSVGAQRNGHC